MNRRLIAITPVDHPGGAETTLLRLLAGLKPGLGRSRSRRRATDRCVTRRWPPATPGTGCRWAGSLAAPGLGRSRRGHGSCAGAPGRRRLPERRRVRPAAAGAAAPHAGPRLVLHIHDMVSRVPRFWRRADVVLAGSEAVAGRLAGLHARVVYAPVDPDPPERAPPWPTGNGPVIGFVGRIEPRKGPLDLVRAAPAIRRGAPGRRVVVVGDDPYGTDPDYTRAVLELAQIEHYPLERQRPGPDAPPRRARPALPPGAVRHRAGRGDGGRHAGRGDRVDGLPEVVATASPAGSSRPAVPTSWPPRCSTCSPPRRDGRRGARPARRFYVDDYVTTVEELIAP